MTALTLRTRVTRHTLAAAFALITLGLVGGGYWYYQAQANAIHESNYETIATIAKMKTGQIEQWRKERLMDAARNAKTPVLVEALGMIKNHAETPEIRDQVLKLLEVSCKEESYAQVFVLSPSRQVLFSAGDAPVSISAVTQRAVASSLGDPEGVISDFFRISEGEVDIDTVVALWDAGKNLLGFVVQRSRADDDFYPLIQSWPTPSRSAETLLVQRDGDEVVFLNELRHRAKSALSLRYSLKQTEIPAVQAVLGRQGMFDGMDYRNVAVLADLCAIPGSPWFMVTKVDRSEILAEARYRAASTGVTVGALILLAASAAASVYTRQQAGLFKELFKAERQQREIHEQFRTILYSIGDAVITTDIEGRVQTMNAVAERLTGWGEAEANGKPLDEVFRIINQDTRAMVDNPVNTVLRSGVVVSLANHTLLIARDGTEHAIADSAAPIRDDSGSLSGVVLVVSDVTEQYQVRLALRRREQEYRMLFEGMLEGFALHEVICDDSGQPVDYRFLSMNPAFERLTGLRAADTVGRTVREIMPETEAYWVERYGRVALTGEPVHFEEHSSALKRDFKVAAFCPQPNQFAVVCEDITERKAAEARVARLTQLYAALSQCNQAIVHATNVEGLLPQICHDVVQFGGMKMAWIGLIDEASGWIRPVASYGSGTDYLEGLRVSVEGQESWGRGPTGAAIRNNEPSWCPDFQNDPRTAPWHERGVRYGWGASASLPLCLRGKPIGALVIYSEKTYAFDEEVRDLLIEMSNDISFALDSFNREAEREQTEARLRLQSGALEAAANAIVITNNQGVIEWANAAFTTYTGYSVAEAIGQKPSLLNSGKHDEAFYRNLWETILAGEVWQGEMVNRRKDGSLYSEEMTITPMKDNEGEITHFIGVKQDITERKQMEENLLRTQRMESIGTLASGVAHDLNNILTPITLSADMLRAADNTATRECFISTIEECAKRGADVVNQVLTFARGAKGEHTPLQLNRLVNEMEKIMHETFPKNITISSSIPDDLWPVKGDPTQIHQVLLNLCINGRDAMPEGGTLLIAAENQEIDENFAAMVPDAKAGDYVMLAVADTGKGIPRAIIGKIFEPFFTTKDIGQGTGLGLSTVIGIVRSHGGFVTVESEEGRGSTFKFFLPVGTGETAEPRKVAPMEMPQGKGETVLVVDDEDFIAKVTSMVLEKNGYKVLTAAEGAEALALYMEHASEIKIVLTDVMMPGMDGVSLARALKEAHARVKIIASTGQATETRQTELRALGINLILRKPYDAKELLAALHTAIHADPVS